MLTRQGERISIKDGAYMRQHIAACEALPGITRIAVLSFIRPSMRQIAGNSDVCRAHFVLLGSARYIFGSKEVTLEPGDFVCVPERVSYRVVLLTQKHEVFSWCVDRSDIILNSSDPLVFKLTDYVPVSSAENNLGCSREVRVEVSTILPGSTFVSIASFPELSMTPPRTFGEPVGIYVLEGHGVCRLGKETFTVGPGDFFTVPQDLRYQMKIFDEPLKALVWDSKVLPRRKEDNEEDLEEDSTPMARQ